MKESLVGDAVCRKFCTYYKPSSPEELACRGFAVAEILHGRGLISLPDEVQADAADVFADEELAAGLVRTLCAACEFQEADCDFAEDVRAGVPFRKARTACGGYLFLARLVSRGALDPEAISQAARN
ncbi:MAG: hypothetical protein OHK006_04780 [Thermodesulfovibrionales bacterium]